MFDACAMSDQMQARPDLKLAMQTVFNESLTVLIERVQMAIKNRHWKMQMETQVKTCEQ